MITIEYTLPRKVNLVIGTTIIDKAPVEAILKELENHELLSSSGKDWVRFSELDCSIPMIHIVAENDTHLALELIYGEFVDTRFYRLKTKG